MEAVSMLGRVHSSIKFAVVVQNNLMWSNKKVTSLTKPRDTRRLC